MSPFVKAALLCFFLAAVPLNATADSIPVGVSYTASGSTGAWILDFSVTNNVSTAQNVYFFGVLLPAQKIVGAPSGFSPFLCGTGHSCVFFNTSGFGGPNVDWNNMWLASTLPTITGIAFGNTLSGFDAEVNTVTAPTSAEWFAFSLGNSPYTAGGSGSFFPGDNPGFAGFAELTSTATPEPSSLLLFGTGLLGLAFGLRRKGLSRSGPRGGIL
jgi:hypothetical protein